jgi:type VI secretion system secreted protein Hcp
MEKSKVVLILLVVLVLASAGSLYDSPSASAQVVTSGEPVIYFLKLEGIEGESEHSLHKDELVITSYSWEESSMDVPHLGGGGGRAAAEIEDFNFTAPLSKASPKLMQSVAQGNSIDEAVFTVRKVMGDQQPVLLEVKLERVFVTDYHTSSIGYRPIESFSLNFAKITYTYYVYDDAGNFEETIVGGWNVEANKPLDS